MQYIDHTYINLIGSKLDRFSKKRDTLYNCRCPLCGDSQKHTYKARGFFFEKKGKFFYMCHNCGASMSFSKFLSIVDAEMHKQYTLEKWKDVQPKKEEPPKDHTPLKFYYDIRDGSVVVKEDPAKFDIDFKAKFKDKIIDFGLTPVNKLEDTHPAKQYLVNRKIPKLDVLYYTEDFKAAVNSMIDRFGDKESPRFYDGLVENEKRIVIPFFDLNKRLIALQGRSLESSGMRYITIKIDETAEKIYGLERINKNETVYVTEGPIDSLFLDNALAMAGSDVSMKYFDQFDDVVFIFDNEPRNAQIVNRMLKIVDSGFRIFVWPSRIDEKDINDAVLAGMEKPELHDIITKNTSGGLESKLKIAEWKRC
jgi:hypothetical protein